MAEKSEMVAFRASVAGQEKKNEEYGGLLAEVPGVMANINAE